MSCNFPFQKLSSRSFPKSQASPSALPSVTKTAPRGPQERGQHCGPQSPPGHPHPRPWASGRPLKPAQLLPHLFHTCEPTDQIRYRFTTNRSLTVTTLRTTLLLPPAPPSTLPKGVPCLESHVTRPSPAPTAVPPAAWCQPFTLENQPRRTTSVCLSDQTRGLVSTRYPHGYIFPGRCHVHMCLGTG